MNSLALIVDVNLKAKEIFDQLDISEATRTEYKARSSIN